MADQRRALPFRLPWLPARPTVEKQPPTQPTTTTPAQRPPFRPPEVAPAQPPSPQAPAPALAPAPAQPPSPQAPPPPPKSKTESQPSSPSRAASQSQVTSQPTSPHQATTQPQTSSQPPSPSRAAPQFQVVSQPSTQSNTASLSQPAMQTASLPQSPSLLASRPAGQTYSLPPSPSRAATRGQQTAAAISQAKSPPKKLQATTQESSQPLPSSTQPALAASQQELKPDISQPVLQESQPMTEITSQAVSRRNQIPVGATSQPDRVATQPPILLGQGATAAPASTTDPVLPQKSDSSTSTADVKPLPESQENSREIKEGKKIAQELRKQEKINSPADEPKQRTVAELLTAASGSKMQTREQLTIALQAEQRQVEKQETLDKKEALTTSGSDGKQIKTVISTSPNNKNRVSESHQKPNISNGEQAPLHKEIKEDIYKFVHKLTNGSPNQPLDEKSASVVTLTGENIGASMQLGSEPAKRGESIHIYRGYKTNPDESTETTTDGEGSSKERRSKDKMTKQDPVTKAYINSNIQSVNNSILFNSSVTESNPGVQLAFSDNTTDQIKSDSKTESLETHKAEFNITPAQKLTYEPTVRRRCLRGLFMEPSDSDTDNPEKPRRHGCRYNCREVSKDNKIDVL